MLRFLVIYAPMKNLAQYNGLEIRKKVKFVISAEALPACARGRYARVENPDARVGSAAG